MLDALKSYKLDDLNSSIKKNDTKKLSGSNVYFAKYLTSPKVIDFRLVLITLNLFLIQSHSVARFTIKR